MAGLSSQLQFVYDRQVRLTWREHVDEQVTGRDIEMRQRRSLVANTLLGSGVVAKKDLPRLTADLAAAYATCGAKTLTRDVNELVALDLIEEREGGYAARETVLLNLLPLVVAEPPAVDSA